MVSIICQQLHIDVLNIWIKDFNFWLRFSSNTNCDYIDNANITLNEVCTDGLHLSGKGKYVLINNYLVKVWEIFISSLAPTDEHTQGNFGENENRFCWTIYKY